MRALGRVLAVLACLVLAAHFLRRSVGSGDPLPWAGVIVCLALPFLLLVRASWGRTALRVALAAGTVVWIVSAASLWRERTEERRPAARGVAILGGVAVVTALAAVLVPLRDTRSDNS